MRTARRAKRHFKGYCFRQTRGVWDSMSHIARRSALGLILCAATTCSAGRHGDWQHIGNVQRVEKLQNGVELTAGSAKLRITAFVMV